MAAFDTALADTIQSGVIVRHNAPIRNSHMNHQRFLFPSLALLTLWRFALLPTYELSPVEALAAVSGAHPGWAWCDSSPVLVALVKASTWLLGQSAVGVRYFAPLLAFGATLCVWRLAKGLFDEQTAAWSVVIVNVLPAFNLAAITLTAGTIAFAGYAALAESMRVALHSQRRWHPAWLGAALGVIALIFSDGRNALPIAAVFACLGWLPVLRKHVLPRREFWCLVGVWFVSFVVHGCWHVRDLSNLAPGWRVIPNLFRWIVMASPMLLWLFVWVFRHAKKNSKSEEIKPSVALLAAFTLPLLAIDFGWGLWSEWPDVCLSAWLMFGVVLLTHLTKQNMPVGLKARVSIRTLVIALAAAQSFLVMRTDLIRSAGITWPFSQRPDNQHTYTRFLKADPSASMNGWTETAKIVRSVMKSSSGENNKVIVMADRWQLAAPVAFYLGSKDVPDLRIWSPSAATAKSAASDRGASVLYITDDVRCKAVPESLARACGDARIVSIAQIMHGGYLVRTIKIFACHSYQPPDL